MFYSVIEFDMSDNFGIRIVFQANLFICEKEFVFD
jgi:hypothetical protein